MVQTYEEFLSSLTALRDRVAAACATAGRDAGTVTILPVTKTHPVDAALFAARAGLPAVGENRVQEAMPKIEAARGKGVRWELIGHLQSNKAKLAAVAFDRIQSVDSEKLLDLLDRAAGEAGRRMPVLLQLNAGNDPTKSGASVEDAPRLLAHAAAKAHLHVEGLMTIAPLSDDPAVARRTFAALREIRDRLATPALPLRELSMGMTGDLAEAIAEGSTMIRVGTALFGSRPA
ncbi:MAG TPA: YggS family pyridoxal phosphate-dependent enzyme [Opitutaceae bacterium]|nr:YggS family pyridoxal phosphate-dependent enzyme [Opitutaceae bacterium]